MIRVAPILLLGAACAHGGALDRRTDSEMKNDSPAMSPWTGPEDNPIADVGGDVAVTAVVNRVHGMAVEVFAAW